ncbi:MAG: hypothetical protein GXO63_02270 [Candidatus Micrarchaeota archaeon]|nr:hypothetical protein [Candidatus Micrarchaeota archaeon]
MGSAQGDLVRSLSAGGPVELIGGKAYRLSILTKYFNVPTGFVVTTKSYDIWKNNKILPQETIEEYFNSPYLLEGRGPVIVRSSANVEDQHNFSFPGVFDTYSNLNTVDEILDAIEKIFKSVTSKRAISYCRSVNVNPDKIKMACLIQRLIKPKYSGILFTRDVNGKNRIIIEYVKGSGEGLTNGYQNPTRIYLQRDIINNKDIPNFISDLVITSLEIEDIFGMPQDIEWAFDGKNVYILQSKDIVLSSKKDREKPTDKKATILKGVPASPGKAEGVAQFILDDQPPEEAKKLFKKGNILVTYVLHAEYYPIFIKARGIVTKVNTILAHPAIFARELGIPCVVGVDVEYITDGDIISIDGYTGEVFVYNPRNVLKSFNLIEVNNKPESTEAKNIEKEYIAALEELDVEKIRNILRYSFKRIKRLYLEGDQKKCFEIYYLINSLMEKSTPDILSRKFKDFHVIIQKADKKEKPRNETEEKIFKIYNLIKKYINYQTEDSKDIPKLLFGVSG